jgi:hypothetical protein
MGGSLYGIGGAMPRGGTTSTTMLGSGGSKYGMPTGGTRPITGGASSTAGSVATGGKIISSSAVDYGIPMGGTQAGGSAGTSSGGSGLGGLVGTRYGMPTGGAS